MSYNKKVHLRQNIDAIKLAFELDKDNRKATAQEREILSNYSGFGGIKAILNPADKPEDIQQWPKSEVEPFPLVQELHAVLRENSTTAEEYKRYISSLKSSILTAFYTPKPIIDTIASAIKDSGVIPARFLEPSAGVGSFISSFKNIAPDASIVCFEKDLLTGKILSQRYPEDTVRVEGYEKLEGRYSQYFDVIASNILFGDIAVFDPLLSKHDIPVVRQSTQAIHNYFFVKSVMAAREGGVIAFVTSQGVLNSEQNKPIREYLMNSCNVVSAIRLPNNLFSDYAGTEVGSDLIILQRCNNNILLSQRQRDFIESRVLSNGISINNLFRDFDRVIQTHSKIDTDPYGKPAIIFTHEGGIDGIANDLQQMLSEDFAQHFDLNHYQTFAQDPSAQIEVHQSIASPSQNAGTLFDTDNSALQQPTSEVLSQPITQEPVISLYELFGFTQAERSQVKPSRKKEKKPTPAKKDEPEVLDSPPLEWRERLMLQARQKREQQANVYPVEDARRSEQQEILKLEAEREERMKPISYTLEEIPSHYREGSLVTDEHNRIGYLRELNGFQPMFHPLELTATQQMKASLYIEIRDTYHHLYQNEATRLEANPALREMLNRLYDDFTHRFGNINDPKNLSLIKMDAGGVEILSLERYVDGKVIKVDIFQQPVAFNHYNLFCIMQM